MNDIPPIPFAEIPHMLQLKSFVALERLSPKLELLLETSVRTSHRPFSPHIGKGLKIADF
jgi:hypothetical protein